MYVRIMCFVFVVVVSSFSIWNWRVLSLQLFVINYDNSYTATSPRCRHLANSTKYNVAFHSAQLAPLCKNVTSSTKPEAQMSSEEEQATITDNIYREGTWRRQISTAAPPNQIVCCKLRTSRYHSGRGWWWISR